MEWSIDYLKMKYPILEIVNCYIEMYSSIFLFINILNPVCILYKNFYFKLYIIPIEFILGTVYNNLNKANNNQKHLGNWIGFTLSATCAIMIVSDNNCINHKGGENMDVLEEMNGAEIIQRGIEDFREVQDYMVLAKKENAVETYAKLKEKYISLKALLNSLGVNMTDIDKIKE